MNLAKTLPSASKVKLTAPEFQGVEVPRRAKLYHVPANCVQTEEDIWDVSLPFNSNSKNAHDTVRCTHRSCVEIVLRRNGPALTVIAELLTRYCSSESTKRETHYLSMNHKEVLKFNKNPVLSGTVSSTKSLGGAHA